MGSRARAKRIGERFPWPFGPMISRTLSRCGDCPDRLFCIERNVTGPGSIGRIIGTIGRCPEGPAPRSNMSSRTAAAFVRDNCKGCRALPSCCASVEWHAERRIVTIEDTASDLTARPLFVKLDRCSGCDSLPLCMASWMREMNIGMGSLLIGYLRMRWNCPRSSNVR